MIRKPPKPISFTLAEINQMLAYRRDRDISEHSGWYYGNKAQFEARHEQIKLKLLAALEDNK